MLLKNEYDTEEMAEPDIKKTTKEFLKFGDVKIKKWNFLVIDVVDVDI